MLARLEGCKYFSILDFRSGYHNIGLLEKSKPLDLRIKTSKCEFFKSHVCYLGFLIGESGIRCDNSKVEAINKITIPTSIDEVRHFNGMCSYYHKFISHYSDITKCFNDMTKKGAVFKWTKECNTAFKLLKEKLMEEPVLISPQVNKDYVINCDASKYSYLGILQQSQEWMNLHQ